MFTEEAESAESASFFVDKDEVSVLIATTIADETNRLFPQCFGRLGAILPKYQEQPLLLNPHLHDMVTPLTNEMLRLGHTMQNNHDESFRNALKGKLDGICKIIQLICRVRGFKGTKNFFPHEVDHLELCTWLINQQDRKDYENWETRYVLLLWLSVLCLIPFDICSLDSTLQLSTDTSVILDTKSRLVDDIVSICVGYLGEAGLSRDAAASCLSSLLSRPDMGSRVLHEFVISSKDIIANWIANNHMSIEMTGDYFRIVGTLQAVTQVFKKGDRSSLLQKAVEMLEFCRRFEPLEKPTIIRKLLCKTYQRIGLVLLKVKVAPWRYQRGHRSLANNLQQKQSLMPSGCTGRIMKDGDEDDDDDYNLRDGEIAHADEIEEVVDVLLESMIDKDTVVRWSAAKGLGRITERLPKEYADDVVGAILEAFCDEEDDAAWQGACLALAELARRGLLLPTRLSDGVISIVEKAIQFDVLRGQHSVGAHVRDAACYLCWSFARAYSPDVMLPHMQTLSEAMLTTALFDREINCRRAAAAAFQENVGRQGHVSVPNGIEIISIADYFSLGNRIAAFTRISHAVAKLDHRLFHAFTEHLRDWKLFHWDIEIRQLSAKALSKLADIDRGFAVQNIKELLPTCLSANLAERHGAILGVAELLVVISFIPGEPIPEDMLNEIVQIPSKLDKARLFRRRGAEMVREVCCLLIENIARAGVKLAAKTQVALVDVLNENLRQPHESIQVAASSALRHFLWVYFGTSTSAPSEKLQKATVDKYIEGLAKDENVAVTRGYALAIGALPERLLAHPKEKFDSVIECLFASMHASARVAGEPDAETRRNAAISLVEIIEKLECNESLLRMHHIVMSFKALMAGCADYSVDSRGDIGSWVRSVCLRGIERLLYTTYRRKSYPNARSYEHICITPLGPGTIVSDKQICESKAVDDSPYQADTGSIAVVTFPPMSLGATFAASKSAFNVYDTCTGDDDNIRDQSHNDVQNLTKALFTKVLRYDCMQRNASDDKDCIACGQTETTDVTPIAETLAHCSVAPTDSATVDDIPVAECICIILKLLSEKLDSVREVAGTALARIVKSVHPDIPRIPDKAKVKEIIENFEQNVGVVGIDWSQPSIVFSIITKLLDLNDMYFSQILSGFVISMGSISETISKVSSELLITYCVRASKDTDKSRIRRVGNELCNLFEANKGTDRVIIPLIKTSEALIRNGLLEGDYSDTDGCALETGAVSKRLLQLVRDDMNDSKEVVKIKLCADLLILFLQQRGSVRAQSLRSLVVLLGHKYPRIRKHVAECLYLQLLADSDAVGPLAAFFVAEMQKKSASSSVLIHTDDKQSTESVGAEGVEEKKSEEHNEASPTRRSGSLCMEDELDRCGFARTAGDLDKASEMLVTTEWETIAIAQARTHRLALMNLLQIPVQSASAQSKQGMSSTGKAGKGKARATAKDELDSYEALVREAGY